MRIVATIRWLRQRKRSGRVGASLSPLSATAAMSPVQRACVREKRFREAKLGCLYYCVCSYDVRQRAAFSSGDDAWAVLRFLSPPRGMRTVFLGSSQLLPTYAAAFN